jgi:hypothetical protein
MAPAPVLSSHPGNSRGKPGPAALTGPPGAHRSERTDSVCDHA